MFYSIINQQAEYYMNYLDKTNSSHQLVQNLLQGTSFRTALDENYTYNNRIDFNRFTSDLHNLFRINLIRVGKLLNNTNISIINTLKLLPPSSLKEITILNIVDIFENAIEEIHDDILLAIENFSPEKRAQLIRNMICMKEYKLPWSYCIEIIAKTPQEYLDAVTPLLNGTKQKSGFIFFIMDLETIPPKEIISLTRIAEPMLKTLPLLSTRGSFLLALSKIPKEQLSTPTLWAIIATCQFSKDFCAKKGRNIAAFFHTLPLPEQNELLSKINPLFKNISGKKSDVELCLKQIHNTPKEIIDALTPVLANIKLSPAMTNILKIAIDMRLYPAEMELIRNSLIHLLTNNKITDKQKWAIFFITNLIPKRELSAEILTTISLFNESLLFLRTIRIEDRAALVLKAAPFVGEIKFRGSIFLEQIYPLPAALIQAVAPLLKGIDSGSQAASIFEVIEEMQPSVSQITKLYETFKAAFEQISEGQKRVAILLALMKLSAADQTEENFKAIQLFCETTHDYDYCSLSPSYREIPTILDFIPLNERAKLLIPLNKYMQQVNVFLARCMEPKERSSYLEYAQDRERLRSPYFQALALISPEKAATSMEKISSWLQSLSNMSKCNPETIVAQLFVEDNTLIPLTHAYLHTCLHAAEFSLDLKLFFASTIFKYQTALQLLDESTLLLQAMHIFSSYHSAVLEGKRSSLHAIVDTENSKAVALFLKNISLDKRDALFLTKSVSHKNWIPLFCAIDRNQFDIVRLLLAFISPEMRRQLATVTDENQRNFLQFARNKSTECLDNVRSALLASAATPEEKKALSKWVYDNYIDDNRLIKAVETVPMLRQPHIAWAFHAAILNHFILSLPGSEVSQELAFLLIHAFGKAATIDTEAAEKLNLQVSPLVHKRFYHRTEDNPLLKQVYAAWAKKMGFKQEEICLLDNQLVLREALARLFPAPFGLCLDVANNFEYEILLDKIFEKAATGEFPTAPFLIDFSQYLKENHEESLKANIKKIISHFESILRDKTEKFLENSPLSDFHLKHKLIRKLVPLAFITYQGQPTLIMPEFMEDLIEAKLEPSKRLANYMIDSTVASIGALLPPEQARRVWLNTCDGDFLTILQEYGFHRMETCFNSLPLPTVCASFQEFIGQPIFAKFAALSDEPVASPYHKVIAKATVKLFQGLAVSSIDQVFTEKKARRSSASRLFLHYRST